MGLYCCYTDFNPILTKDKILAFYVSYLVFGDSYKKNLTTKQVKLSRKMEKCDYDRFVPILLLSDDNGLVQVPNSNVKTHSGKTSAAQLQSNSSNSFLKF